MNTAQTIIIFEKNHNLMDKQVEDISVAILQKEYGEDIITPEGWHPARFRAAIKQWVRSH